MADTGRVTGARHSLSEVNGGSVSFIDRKSQQYKAALTWFVDGLAGSHEFNGGAELRKLSNDGNNFLTGDRVFTCLDPGISGVPDGDVNGDGRIDYLLYNYDPQFRPPIKSTGDVGSAFVQNQWRPTSNLTLQLGVRYDTASCENKRGTTVADFDTWQPRIGVAWDGSALLPTPFLDVGSVRPRGKPQRRRVGPALLA